jgi:hypothetical protein
MEAVSREFIIDFMKKANEQGLLIEAGWYGYILAAYPKEFPSAEQLYQERACFFAGAQHLFSSIMNILEPGAEPTEVDLVAMDNIHKELTNFIEMFKKHFNIKEESDDN